MPKLIGHTLIDSFIENDKGKIVLNENPTLRPDVENEDDETEKMPEESYFTETLARIYIKQGRYSKALEIIRRLSLQYPKKNAYFADQIRFLEKLIINNNKKQ
jgi:thioredoxin-like negative regulator of GroEL